MGIILNHVDIFLPFPFKLIMTRNIHRTGLLQLKVLVAPVAYDLIIPLIAE